jgi:hypothetical protein
LQIVAPSGGLEMSILLALRWFGLVWFELGFDGFTVCRFDRLASVSASHGIIFPVNFTPNHAPAIVYLVAYAPNHGFDVFPHGSE